MFIIGGVQKSSLIDFPHKIAAIVFTQGCNFSCGYCHNAELIDFSLKSHFGYNEFFEFLNTRKGKLDGVVITGGEPTLQSSLRDFIIRIKELGFEVKLDTNGTNPEVLEKLTSENLLDYIAMDIKAPWEKYPSIVHPTLTLPVQGGENTFNTENLKKSVELIMSSKVDYEFRTTVIKSQLSFEDFELIGGQIRNAKRYYLQKFVPSKILDKSLENEKTYSDEEFSVICEMLRKYIKVVGVR